MKPLVNWNLLHYSAHRLIGSRILESVAYCNQILLAPLYLNSTQNTLVNWIIGLLLSLQCWPKVILLSGGHYLQFKTGFRVITWWPSDKMSKQRSKCPTSTSWQARPSCLRNIWNENNSLCKCNVTQMVYLSLGKELLTSNTVTSNFVMKVRN